VMAHIAANRFGNGNAHSNASSTGNVVATLDILLPRIAAATILIR